MRELGRTGIQGRLGNPDHEDCARMVHRALDAGINFIDTADVYGHSETEHVVGKALGGRRRIIAEMEHSLRRPRTNCIDLYQLHHPDPATDIEESLSALTDLVRTGKARAIGTHQRMRWVPGHLTDERKLDAVERLLTLADDAGLSLPHLATAFATAHPDASPAIIGPRTGEQPADLLAGAGTTLDDGLLTRPAPRRRPAGERAAA
ncbi:aldo/keto reductase [Streptomyces sp. NPDC023723]|uniref:aldo/keto reductase n=1 Tax=Streptomyces sp. NPDC023723 TaxID=3154323 RepID=UPI0033FFB1BF